MTFVDLLVIVLSVVNLMIRVIVNSQDLNFQKNKSTKDLAILHLVFSNCALGIRSNLFARVKKNSTVIISVRAETDHKKHGASYRIWRRCMTLDHSGY